MNKFYISIAILCFTFSIACASAIKEPNVAGQFYEGHPERLKNNIEFFLAQANQQSIDRAVDVIIVPHAGHRYSAPVAAYSFQAIREKKYQTIVLLGPTHYYRFDGVAIWPEGGFRTPLGTVEVDQDLAHALIGATDQINPHAQAFERDHVLEVELPFIQHLFPEAKIVPMIMDREASRQTLQNVADALHQSMGEREDVLLLISSDLSHYHDAQIAYAIDQRGLNAVKKMDLEAIWNGHLTGSMEIDGYKEVMIGLMYAQKRGSSQVKLLKYGHSGESSGDYSRVVGYGALIIHR